MRFDTRNIAVAATLTMTIAYIACVAFVALLPEFSFKLFGLLVHIVNVDKFAGDVQLTFGGFIAGLLQVVIYTFLVAWLFAWIYNRRIKV